MDRYRDWTPDLVSDPDRRRRLRQLGLLDTPPEEPFDRLTRLATRLLDVPIALVSLVDEDRQYFKSQVGLAEPWGSLFETPLDRSFCQYTLGSAEPMVVEDARLDPFLRENRAIEDLGVIAYLGMPLITDDGHAIGTLCAIDHKPRQWTADEIGELQDLAGIAAQEIAFRQSRWIEQAPASIVAPNSDEQVSAVGQVDREGLEALLLHSRDIVLILSLDHTIQYISSTVEHLLHCTPLDLVGQKIAVLLGPEESDFQFLVSQLACTGRSVGTSTPPVVRLQCGTGPGRVFEFVSTDLRADPLIDGYVINLRDTGDHQESASQLEAGAAYYRALVQQTSDLTTIIDIDGTIRYDSPAKVRMFGYGPGGLIGRNSREFIHPDDLDDMLAGFQESLANGVKKTTMAYRFRHADGSWRWLESVADNLLANPEVAGVVISSRDVTEQRLTEEALRQAYLTTLIRHATDVVTVLDRNHAIRYASPSVETVLGYAPALCVGLMAVDIFHPADRDVVLSMLGRLSSEERSVVRFEARAKHQIRGWRWLEVAATNLVDEPGIKGIVVNARDITDRRELEQRLAHEATHDALTGLPNRSLFIKRLRQRMRPAMRKGEHAAVLFVDLDDFKLINDSLGHAAGDALLQVAGQRIQGQLKRSDVVSRFGGDEFTVLVNHNGVEADAVRVAEGIMAAIHLPVTVNGQETRLRASIGIAVSTPDLSDPHELLRAADTALYRAKAAGGESWSAYTPLMAEEARSRLRMKLQLRHALERGELRVRYQPVVDLADGKIVGLEALVRWQHSELGLLAPAAFLDVAQASGLIEPIGQWVLEQACAQAARWLRLRPIWVAVNIAPQQLRQPDFVDQIVAAVDRAGIDPSVLHLEITESVTAREGIAYLEHLHALRRMGVRLAIDDFGTGESSLAALRRYPIDTVKIDREFIAGADTDDDAAAIVRAVVGIGRALGLRVIAEGVETEGEHRLLRGLGCAYAQGYLFGRPMLADDITARLQAQISAQTLQPIIVIDTERAEPAG